MSRRFEGQVAVVTGGGTGLGLAMATRFAQDGAHVVIASRNEEHLAGGVAAIEAAGGQATSVPVDVRDEALVQQLIDRTLDELGRLDILVNNAAGNFVCAAEDYTPNGWRTITDIVLNGTFLCSWAAGRHWIGTGAPGHILNIVSTHIHSGCPGLAASAASKAAVANLTQTLAVEWAAHGIRVNAIAPGVFPNPTVQAQMHPEESSTDPVERARRTVPLGRPGDPAELGRIASWLCSEEASYITGHVLVVDGANWLRRGHLMPEYRTVPQQLAERGLR